MKNYTCPCCKKEQTTVRMWQTISVGSDFDLSNDDWLPETCESAGDFETCSCPECGQDLPNTLITELKLWERI